MVNCKRMLLALLGGVLVLSVVTGCSGSAPPLTNEEKANFKGGPMPESARQMLQRRLNGMGGPGNKVAPPNMNRPPNAPPSTNPPANANTNSGH